MTRCPVHRAEADRGSADPDAEPGELGCRAELSVGFGAEQEVRRAWRPGLDADGSNAKDFKRYGGFATHRGRYFNPP